MAHKQSTKRHLPDSKGGGRDMEDERKKEGEKSPQIEIMAVLSHRPAGMFPFCRT